MSATVSWELFAAAVVAAAAALLWLVGRWRRWRASRRARRRGARAVRGEHDAEVLLEDLGYRIVDRQSTLRWTIDCDGEPVEIELRADLLVERDGALQVAEVKTGDRAPRIDTAATRRQLLEYAVAYQADGVLLVDVEAGAVVEVRFPGLALRQGAERAAG